MIDFIASGDPATDDNLEVYRHFNKDLTTTALTEWVAVRSSISGLLDESWFIMSHGSIDSIIGTDGLAAIDRNNICSLGAKSIFAFCCLSAEELGRFAAQNGINYIGFGDIIPSPPTSPNYIRPIIEIFEFIRSNMSDITTDAESLNFLSALKRRIETCELAFDIAECSEVEYIFLRKMRTKIVIRTAENPDSEIVDQEYNERPLF